MKDRESWHAVAHGAAESLMTEQLNFFLMQMVSRTEGNIDDSLIGGNASAEGPEGEGTDVRLASS